MKPNTSARPIEVAGAIAIAVGLALGSGVALKAMTTPSQLTERLAALQAKSDEVKRLRVRASASTIPVDASCPQLPVAAGDRLRRDLATLAATANLTDARINLQFESPMAREGGFLEPIAVKFSATGTYNAALAALAAIANLRPTLFVDSVDLHPKVSTVTLNFEGRVFCSVRS